jgi:hypothetical protein
MKLLLSLALLSSSLTALAQSVDSKDLILYSRKCFEETCEYKAAKVEITRARYERMKSENLMMICKLNSDSRLRLVFYAGQVSVHHKDAIRPVAHCEALACIPSGFDKLDDKKNGAINFVNISDSTVPSYNYGIMSSTFYETYINSRKYDYDRAPKLPQIPYLTVYDPSIHTPQTVPVTEGFYCSVQGTAGIISGF